MKQTLDEYFPQLLKHEGGYVDHPKDPGGATNLGITIKTLSNWRGHPVTKADVRALTRAEAVSIYRANYWNKIRGDELLAGPDAALFDIAVNSGPGRAVQWMHLTVGKNAVDAIKAISSKRRAFFQSLSTFKTFGRGWMRRVNEVEAWAIAWSYRAVGANPSGVLKAEANASRATVKKVDATNGGVTGASVAAGANSGGVDWVTIAAVGLPVLLAIGVLIYKSVEHRGRAEALEMLTDEKNELARPDSRNPDGSA